LKKGRENVSRDHSFNLKSKTGAAERDHQKGPLRKLMGGSDESFDERNGMVELHKISCQTQRKMEKDLVVGVAYI